MHTVNILQAFVEQHQLVAYLLIFVGIVFEGEFAVILTGILAHLGAFNFWVALPAILLGGLGKTILGYYFGGLIHKRWNNTRFLKYIEKRVATFLPRFKQKPFWSIFLSKFILGANHVVIIFSGFQKINYKKYLKAEIFSTLLWAPGFLLLGYFFSYTALHISHEIWRFSLIVLILVIVFIIFDKTVSWLYELFEEFYDNTE